MRKRIFQWLGREFIALSCEGRPPSTAPEEAQGIFNRFEDDLRGAGFSLDNTVRTRLWGKDGQTRTLAAEVRNAVLSGKARSASSSYFAPSHFESNAQVSIDLLAMKPSRPGLAKELKEYDPPIIPLRYLIYDSFVFLSGVTAVLPTLADQLADILPRISDSLHNAGVSWDKAVKVSVFLDRNQKLDDLRNLFQKAIKPEIPRMEYGFVDGFSTEGKLVEIEVTAFK